MAQERTANTFRFMPGRKEAAEDEKIIFGGIRYSRTATQDVEKGFLAGVAVGPGQHLPKGTDGVGFKLSEGGHIVPVFPNQKGETVPVRDFLPKRDKTGIPKQYIDWASFEKRGDDTFVVPCFEEKVVYGEFWTGDFDESEGAFQLIQANMFAHGSVAYAGASEGLVVNALDKKRRKKPKEGEVEESQIRPSSAELVRERQGTIVAGIPLWTARLWRLRYSGKDSEAILVRQLGQFYLVQVKNGAIVYDEVPASKFEKSFERLTVDQKLILAPTAESVAA